MNRDIWVVCDNECYNSEHNLQLINKSKHLAELKNIVFNVICIGIPDENALEDIKSYGVNKIIFTETVFQEILIHINILERLVKERKPELLMFPSTIYSKALSAALSSRLQAGLVADCIDITVDAAGDFIYSRVAINDSVIARIKCINSDYELCTVKNNVFMVSHFMLKRKPVIEKVFIHLRIFLTV